MVWSFLSILTIVFLVQLLVFLVYQSVAFNSYYCIPVVRELLRGMGEDPELSILTIVFPRAVLSLTPDPSSTLSILTIVFQAVAQ